MLRTIIIDDEKKGRSVLQKMLEKYFSETVRIIALCDSAAAGRRAIEEEHPDVVFLDVEMPGQNGFELLQSLERIDFNVVFVTAHDEYAIKAIRISALDYLLKPVELKELKSAIEKAEKAKKKGSEAERFDALFHNLTQTQSKIGIPAQKGLVFVQVNDILRCESESNYTTIFLLNGEKHVAAKTLKEYEHLLGGYDFIRVHQSHLINIRHIKQYVKGDGGSVILTDGTQVEVSRRQKDVLLEKIMK